MFRQFSIGSKAVYYNGPDIYKVEIVDWILKNELETYVLKVLENVGDADNPDCLKRGDEFKCHRNILLPAGMRRWRLEELVS